MHAFSANSPQCELIEHSKAAPPAMLYVLFKSNPAVEDMLTSATLF